MLRRGLIVTGLGLSLSLAGVTGAIPSSAQETAVSVPASQGADLAEWEAEQAARYEEFLARFTEQLGLDDPALVETAFKETMKEMIDARFAAGEISANLAEELKTRIDEADGPLLFGRLLPGGPEVVMGRDRGHHGRFLPRGGDHRTVLIRETLVGEGERPGEVRDSEPAGGDTPATESDEAASTPTP